MLGERESYLQENDSTDSWHSMRTKGNDTFLTIDNLQERKGYHFKVRAESEIGYSQYSENGDLIRTVVIDTAVGLKIEAWYSVLHLFQTQISRYFLLN